MSTLHDRLEELAAAAPDGGPTPADLWERGVRRGRARRAAAVAAAVAVVALVAGTTALVRQQHPTPLPAGTPARSLHLPEVVNAPGTWSDDEGPDGPLAALGLSLRTTPRGLTGERQSLEIFGVSAVDGRLAWVELPGIHTAARELVGWYALSPDGRWIGWSRYAAARRPGGASALTGWSVMDTTTGRVRRLSVPGTPRLRDTAADLAFSGDSRYLLTSYETPGAPATRGHRFVAWDVTTGARTVLEQPGERWLPDLGSAPTGVVWSRGRTVHRADPATGRQASYALPQSVVAASWAPDDTAFAWIGRPPGQASGPWSLYAGRSLTDARQHRLPLPEEPRQLLGWVDAEHVVVGRFRSTVEVVDVVTGDVVERTVTGAGKQLSQPQLAADLWQRPLVPAVEPDGTSDPRTPWWWAGGAFLALLVGGLLLRRRRTRA